MWLPSIYKLAMGGDWVRVCIKNAAEPTEITLVAALFD